MYTTFRPPTPQPLLLDIRATVVAYAVVFPPAAFVSDSVVDPGFAYVLADVAGIPGVPANACFFARSLLLQGLLILPVSLLFLGPL